MFSFITGFIGANGQGDEEWKQDPLGEQPQCVSEGGGPGDGHSRPQEDHQGNSHPIR